MRAAAGCCCNGSMNDTTYAYDAGGAASPGTNGSDSYGSNPYGSPAPGPQPKPKRQSDRFFSWIRGSAMERGDVENGFMPAGQVVGIIDDLPPAGEVVGRLVEETRQAYAELGIRAAGLLAEAGGAP